LEGDGTGEKPFYLSVHYTAPHSPWTGHPRDIVDSYDDCAFESCPQEQRHPWAIHLTDECLGDREILKGYFAAVTAMDADVGRILDKLDELNIREDTIVIFTSDNGFSCGQHGFWGKGNGTSPLNMYENSIKVPFVASHPGTIPEGTVQRALMSAYDFMPTLLDYLGLPLPEGGNLPGQSFSGLLRQNGEATRESVVVHDEYGPTRMIRTRDWKYVHRYPDGPNELYDLRNDPDERRSLVAEPSEAARVVEMREQLEEWFRTYVVPEMDGRDRPVSGSGQLERLGSGKGPEFAQLA
jgi:arylsulfatase A-like enzyme